MSAFADTGQTEREARLLVLATELLGAEASARDWIASPAKALEGITPLELCATPEGFVRVETLIFQLYRGVYV